MILREMKPTSSIIYRAFSRLLPISTLVIENPASPSGNFVAVLLATLAIIVSTAYNEVVARFALSFFNTFQATLEGKTITSLGTTNNQGLLIYLVLQAGRLFPREVLATLLWPDKPDEIARNNLRQTIYELRKIIGDLASPKEPLLLVTRHTVQFNAASDFTLDVKQFLQEIDSGDLETALARYSGDLLSGYTCDSLPFEEWLRQEREHLHQTALKAMFELTQSYLQNGRLDKAQATARRQLSLEPWREAAHCQLMQAYALAGDRGNALAQYEAGRQILWQELGVEPTTEMVILYEAIKNGKYGLAALGESSRIPFSLSRNLPAGTVTFLFTDIEGSTELLKRLRDQYVALLTSHHLILREAFERWHGYEVGVEGDSFFVSFQRATNALNAAVEIQKSLAAHTWPDNVDVLVRMGLHTGEPLEANTEDYIGIDVHRAARIAHLGHGGQVLLSESTTSLVVDKLPKGVSLLDLGHHLLKDLSRPEHIHQLMITGLPIEFPPLKSSEIFQHNLPLQLTSFIGRQKESARLTTLLAINRSGGNRLITLTGSGGIGKTRLSIQAAYQLLPDFKDGVWLVELAPLVDPELVHEAVAAVLKVRRESSQPLLATLANFLHERTLLLMLDNCEHLIEACAQLAEHLLRHCPNLRILASSREALGIEGETAVRVPSLSLPPAEQVGPTLPADFESVQLFVERASTALPGFGITESNAAAIIQVCRRLDGIALAIELAAARVKTLRVEQIASRLDDAFRLLTAGSRTALPRQQTLRATIDWSYNLLSDAERILLGRFSVFAGGWTLEAAEFICPGEGLEAVDVLDWLTQLVGKSLVVAERQLGQETRYHLLEMTRQFAREKLLESGQGEAMRDLHLAFYLDLAEEIDVRRKSAERLACMRQFDNENDNFRAALEWAMTEPNVTKAGQGIRLASALMIFWHRRGRFQEGRDWLKQTLALAGGSHREAMVIRAKALYAAAYLAWFDDADSSTASLIEESISLYRKIVPSEKQDFAEALNLCVFVYIHHDPVTARALIEESVAICRDIGPSGKWELAEALFWKGHFAFLQEDDTVARACVEESQLLWRQTGDVWEAAAPISTLGHIAVRQGDYATAITSYEDSLRLWKEGGDAWGVAASTEWLGLVERIMGDYAAASKRIEECLRLWRDMGKSVDLEVGIRDLGIVTLFQGDYERAAALLVESLPLLRENPNELDVAFNLAGLSGVASAQGKGVRAARLLGAAEPFIAFHGSWLGVYGVAYQTDYDRLVASARSQLSEAAFAAAWAEGQAMNLEQAILYALAEDGIS